MTNETLVDRYVALAIRSLSKNEKTDVERELRASIADAIDARVDAGLTEEEAERSTLEEMGDPARLASRLTDRPMWLLGPDFYFYWRRLLIRILAIALPSVTITHVLIRLFTDESPSDGLVGSTISLMLTVFVHIVFWTTLAFVVAERSGVTAASVASNTGTKAGWSVDLLPATPMQRKNFGELITLIVTTGLWIGAIIWQENVGFIDDANGEDIALFQSDLWTSWIPLYFVCLGASVAIAVLQYRAGRWTGPLIAANALTHIAIAGGFVWLLLKDRLLNLAFIDAFDANVSTASLDITSGVVAAAFALTALYSIGDSVRKWRRQDAD